MYKQDVPQNNTQSIVPDLAVSWSWSEEGTELTFPLRQGVKWQREMYLGHADRQVTGQAAPQSAPWRSSASAISEILANDSVRGQASLRSLDRHGVGRGGFDSFIDQCSAALGAALDRAYAGIDIGRMSAA
jgi:hypothetical protein